jgi:Fe-S-cluster containining protein
MPQVNFKIKISGQIIDANVQLPAEKIRPVDLLPILQGFSNAVVGASSEGAPITCRDGCAVCCRQPVPISETEALYLTKLIDDMEPERRAEILNRFDNIVSATKAAGIFDALRPEMLATVEQRHRAGTEYFKLGLACPFLENESCSIHKDRPLSCREYLVVSPAANCATLEPGSVDKIEMPVKLSYTLYKFGDGVGKGQPKFMVLGLMPEYPLPKQPSLPGTELFENFFRAVTAQEG